MEIRHWEMTAVGEPLRLATRKTDALGPEEVLVRVAGCGVCHTDIAFLYDGVKTRHPLPLVLGHEVSGVVEDAGADCGARIGEAVIVPSVMPCGQCSLCKRGRGSICAAQVFPGNDIHGGFATHLVVPAASLCAVPAGDGIDLAALSVVADAVSTPFQAIRRSGLAPGDLAVIVGVGGIGAFGVQIAAAIGADVVAVDIDAERLQRVAEHGASLALNAQQMDARAMKKAIRSHAKERGLAATEWKLFEMSGTAPGQETAFSLLVHGAYLGIVGFTTAKVSVPLSHLMAFDARAEGNWGCLPELYPDALAMVVDGRIKLEPFIERRPMATINQVLEDAHHGRLRRRAVLVPEEG